MTLVEAKTIEEVAQNDNRFVKIFSKRLNASIILLSDEAELKQTTGTFAIYRIYEMEGMERLSDEQFVQDYKIRKKFNTIPLKKSEYLKGKKKEVKAQVK